MHPDGCEVILWREGPRRCELWVMHGRGELRVFDGDQLMRLEALTPGGYARVANDEDGCILLPLVGLRLCLRDNRAVLLDERTGQEVLPYPALARAYEEAEERASEEEEARQKAEKRAQDAEERLRKLEAELKQLRGQPPAG